MEILAVLCHPEPGSFNHAIAESARAALAAAGHDVHFHDLYAERFDPVLTASEIRRGASFDPLVQRCANELESSRALLFVHPEWWGGPPALLKGWIDRVFRVGLAYELAGEEFLAKRPRGLLADRRALVLTTTQASKQTGESALELFWARAVFDYCGIADRRVRILHALRETTVPERAAWLSGIAADTAWLTGAAAG